MREKSTYFSLIGKQMTEDVMIKSIPYESKSDVDARILDAYRHYAEGELSEITSAEEAVSKNKEIIDKMHNERTSFEKEVFRYQQLNEELQRF
jgi:hypothetical protein